MSQALSRFRQHKTIKKLHAQEHSYEISNPEQVSSGEEHNTIGLEQWFDTFHHDVARKRNMFYYLKQQNNVELSVELADFRVRQVQRDKFDTGFLKWRNVLLGN